jgi:hypothetical protein
MTKYNSIEEFLDTLNGAPVELHRIAEELSKLKKKSKIKTAATTFLDAQEYLLSELEKIGFEFG